MSFDSDVQKEMLEEEDNKSNSNFKFKKREVKSPTEESQFL